MKFLNQPMPSTTAITDFKDGDEAGGTGFQSILMKSLAFSEEQFMEVLMEITMLSEASTLTLFVENLSDL